MYKRLETKVNRYILEYCNPNIYNRVLTECTKIAQCLTNK